VEACEALTEYRAWAVPRTNDSSTMSAANVARTAPHSTVDMGGYGWTPASYPVITA
jgi:hypothetical protein